MGGEQIQEIVIVDQGNNWITLLVALCGLTAALVPVLLIWMKKRKPVRVGPPRPRPKPKPRPGSKHAKKLSEK